MNKSTDSYIIRWRPDNGTDDKIVIRGLNSSGQVFGEFKIHDIGGNAVYCLSFTLSESDNDTVHCLIENICSKTNYKAGQNINCMLAIGTYSKPTVIHASWINEENDLDFCDKLLLQAINIMMPYIANAIQGHISGSD